MDNRQSIASVVAEVGDEHFQYFLEFVERHLGRGVEPDELAYRFAPSLIARSECELLSISEPRFAIRSVLPDNSLVHLRRVGFLTRACDFRHIDINSRSELLGPVLAKSAKKPGFVIGDSLLVPSPVRTPSSHWHVLTSSLLGRYQNLSESHRGGRGTPFLRQMALGGGMCAQAACFMANAVLIDEAKALFGVAEITAIRASVDNRPPMHGVSIGGLRLTESRTYFRHPLVGLNAFMQDRHAILPDILKFPSSVTVELYLRALRSYLLSDVPVILHFHYRTLATAALYEDIAKSLLALSPTAAHAIVIVGCTLRGEQEFVVYDPSFRPFVRLTAEEIARACVLDAEGYQPSAAFLACTSSSVALPLFGEPEFADGSKARIGLIDVMDLLRWHPLLRTVSQVFPPDSPGLLPTDEVRLLDMDTTSDEWVTTLCRGDNIDPAALRLLKSWSQSIDCSQRWVWSVHRRTAASDGQRSAEIIVLVDATTVLHNEDLQMVAHRLPLVAFYRFEGATEKWHTARLGHGTIRLSAITSLNPGGTHQAESVLPEPDIAPTIDAVEWYVLQQSEAISEPLAKFASDHSFQYATSADFLEPVSEL